MRKHIECEAIGDGDGALFVEVKDEVVRDMEVDDLGCCVIVGGK